MMRSAAVAAFAAVLGSCSQFNMVARCEETGDGLLRTLAGIDRATKPDRGRLAAIARVSGFAELGSGYNSRRCRATVTLADDSRAADYVYDIRQSEGLQRWYEITLADAPGAEAEAVAGIIAGAYRR